INRCIHSDRSSVSNWTTLLKRDWLYRFLRSTEPLLHELSDLKRIIVLTYKDNCTPNK
ncbi:hypothetical protein C0J52_21600, partial [Blattella germanica]